MDNENNNITEVENISAEYEGALKNIPTKDGVIHGVMTICDDDGNIEEKFTYEDGVLNGSAEFYKNNMPLMFISFKNGVIDGPATMFNNGIKSSEVNFKNGLMEGHFTSFDNHGQVVRDITYLKGKMNGDCYSFFPNGVLQEQSFYVNDLLNGEVKRYYPSGAILEISQFENGNPVGYWTTYNEDGEYYLQRRRNGILCT